MSAGSEKPRFAVSECATDLEESARPPRAIAPATAWASLRCLVGFTGRVPEHGSMAGSTARDRTDSGARAQICIPSFRVRVSARRPVSLRRGSSRPPASQGAAAGDLPGPAPPQRGGSSASSSAVSPNGVPAPFTCCTARVARRGASSRTSLPTSILASPQDTPSLSLSCRNAAQRCLAASSGSFWVSVSRTECCAWTLKRSLASLHAIPAHSVAGALAEAPRGPALTASRSRSVAASSPRRGRPRGVWRVCPPSQNAAGLTRRPRDASSSSLLRRSG